MHTLIRQALNELSTFYTGSMWDRRRRHVRREHRLVGRLLPEPVPVEEALPYRLKMTRSVYEAIRRTVGRLPAETGGALGGRYEDEVITAFRFDAEARRTGATYSPNTAFLNRLFKEDWNPRGIRLLSFVHSHPAGCRYVSHGDRVYAARILAAIPELKRLYLPIVMSTGDGMPFEIVPFVALRDGEGGVIVEEAELVIVADAKETIQEPELILS